MDHCKVTWWSQAGGVGTGICPVVVLVVPKGCGQCAMEDLRKKRRAVPRQRCCPVEQDATQGGYGVEEGGFPYRGPFEK